jgi:hypothetical protein
MLAKLIQASLILSVILTVILPVAAPAAFGADNTFGTYELNFAKSKQAPSPMPRSLTVTREASNGGVKQTTTGEQANGTAFYASYTSKYDGKYVQVTGNAPFDTIAVKRLNANTLTDERNKTGGPYKAVGRTVFSNGGKTMTVTINGTNADGKEFSQLLVFDKK